MTPGSDDAHVALLRGINVGGKNRLPMRGLVPLFEAAGCSEVRTYIQSGNVVFRAPAALARTIPERIAAAIAAGFGLKIPVVTRTRAEMEAVLADNPFLAQGVDPETLHVGFLAARPSAADVARLDPDRSPPDRFVVRGREVYLHHPNGVARSKLTAQYFDSRLGTTITARNWRTVGNLVLLARGS